MFDLLHLEDSKSDWGYKCVKNIAITNYYEVERNVTIFIPTYKNQHLILRCVESCINQTYKNIRIIIIDNGFNECGDSLRHELAKFDDQRVNYMPNTSNIEHLGNFHFILSLAQETSRFIVIPADQLLTEDCIEKMVAVAEKNPSVNMVFPRTINRDVRNTEITAQINSEDKATPWPHKKSNAMSATVLLQYYYSQHNIDSEWTHFTFVGSLIDGALMKSIAMSRPPLFYHGWEELISLVLLSYSKDVAVINEPLYILYTNNERLGWASRPKYNYTRYEPLYVEYYFLETYEPMLIKRGLSLSRLYLFLIYKTFYTMFRYPGIVYLLLPKVVNSFIKLIVCTIPVDLFIYISKKIK